MTEPTRFRKRATEIHAICFDGTNHNAIRAFAPGCFEEVDPEDRDDDPDTVATIWNQRYSVRIPVKAGMWIARDRYGYYPIGAEALAKKYEAVDPGVHDFAWGQSVGLDKSTGTVTLPFNDGNTTAGLMQISIDDVRVLHDMLDGILQETGGNDE